MEIRDLQLGDVLLFSPEKGSWISKTITWLTDAPVSHTAMTYQMYSKLIEETPPQVRVADANQRFVERTIYVMRYTKELENFEPVMQIAKKYLNLHEPYAMSNLYLLGMLLLYKKFTPTDAVQKATLKILKRISAKLLDAINQKEYPNKLPMVCSQFIFQCYKEAGSDFQLSIKSPNLLHDSKHFSLLNHAFSHKPSLKDSLAEGSRIDQPEVSDESLGQELYQHISDRSLLSTGTISIKLLDAIHHFAQAFHALANETGYEEADSKQGLAILQAQESLFVTPGDLLLHCPELTQVGEIKIL